MKPSLMYHPTFISLISIYGILSVVTALYKSFFHFHSYLIAFVIVLPVIIWQRKYMEQNIDMYVLLSTKFYNIPPEIAKKNPKIFIFIAYVAAAVIINSLLELKLPILPVLLATMILLVPIYKRIYEKAIINT